MRTFLSSIALAASLAFLSFLQSCTHPRLTPDSSAAAPAPQAQKYNILFIISDDLRNEPGCYGGRAITPNIDKLAKESVRFDNAFCQFPLCNPSRSSMLTGRYPGATGIYGNSGFFGDKHPDYVSLPKYFKQNGYASLRSGKIFHEGIDDTDAWTEGGEPRGTGIEGDAGDLTGQPLYFVAAQGPTPAGAPQAPQAVEAHGPYPLGTPSPTNPRNGKAPSRDDASLTKAQRSDRWLIMPGNGEQDGDYRKTTVAIELLEKYKDQPFFMGFGLSKPHSPPGAPQKFYELYDLAKIELPPDYQPRPTVPEGFPRGSIRPRNADLFIGRDATQAEAKEMIRAYLASTSYVDFNVGRILDALDRLHLREKTIILFWGDHGYELGEKGKWSKAGSLFEEGDRTPFTVYIPNSKANGQVCPRVVECVDFYPTLVELAGLPQPKGLEGRSIVPLLNNPQLPWDHPAFSIWSEDNRTFTGVALRTEKYRYAEYALGGPLLLDPINDPHQTKNLASDPKYADVVKELSQTLHEFLAKHGPGKATPE